MEKKLTIKKESVLDVLKSVVFAVVITLALVLVFAMIVKFTSLHENVIAPINFIIKTLSIVLGILIGFKYPKGGAIKGAIVGILYTLITYLIFSIINGSFNASLLSVIDVLIMVAIAVVSGIIAVNIKGRKAK